ncbi:hypothetical protein [Novosphingobium resinovorum]|nr:hypothetical protein [Novosphingobium resinovorum]
MAEVTGGDKLAEAMAALRDRVLSAQEVRVGFLEGASYPDGDLNVPTVAAINNFGAPEAGIPARPFFTDMVLRCSPEWGEKFAVVLQSTDYDVKAALELMGVGMSDQLRTEIIGFDSVPNSPVTDLLKERFPTGVGVKFDDVQQARIDVANGEVAAPGKPLVWSGQMLSSVASEVE